jgi:hypothetical protein
MTGRYITDAVVQDLESRLTECDLGILRRVSKLRFVSGSQLTRLHFADGDDASVNARAARRTLLRLTRLGVLARLPRVVGGVRAGSAGFVYCLGLAGQRVAVSHGWQPEGRRRRSVVPGTLFLPHCLEVAELHTLLIQADRSGRIELLELSAEPACHRIYGGVGAQQAILKPDSYLRLGVGNFEDSYFIEIDRGTEGSRALDGQLKRYLDYEATGQEQAARGVFPKTLWLAPNAERAAVIEDCVSRLPHASRELFEVAQFADAVRAVSDTSKETETAQRAALPSEA